MTPRMFGALLVLVLGGAIEARASGEDHYAFLQADRLEYAADDDALAWDLQGWLGGDYNKLWLKAEGKVADGSTERSEVQLLYSRAWTPFFDAQLGVRLDQEPSPNRAYLVLGLQGLAPQWLELDTALFLSDEGDVSARLEAEYDLLLTQRLVLQPRIEVDWSATDVPELRTASGITEAELGLRLRFEWHRRFAPYIGVNWSRLSGGTADLARSAGRSDEDTQVIIGIRLWY